jgi:hypothetical protein
MDSIQDFFWHSDAAPGLGPLLVPGRMAGTAGLTSTIIGGDGAVPLGALAVSWPGRTGPVESGGQDVSWALGLVLPNSDRFGRTRDEGIEPPLEAWKPGSVLPSLSPPVSGQPQRPARTAPDVLAYEAPGGLLDFGTLAASGCRAPRDIRASPGSETLRTRRDRDPVLLLVPDCGVVLPVFTGRGAFQYCQDLREISRHGRHLLSWGHWIPAYRRRLSRRPGPASAGRGTRRRCVMKHPASYGGDRMKRP